MIERLDHLVLTVADIDATLAFCLRVLGMRAVTFACWPSTCATPTAT